jgi:flagellar basal body-associated protein FliL
MLKFALRHKLLVIFLIIPLLLFSTGVTIGTLFMFFGDESDHEDGTF